MNRAFVIAATIALAVTPARAGDPAPVAPPPPAVGTPAFWTEDELKLIDRGLEIVNCDRKDLQFQKRPIDDPFRLPVVNRILDDPLSIGGEAQAWDLVARQGSAWQLFDRAGWILEPSPPLGSGYLPQVMVTAPTLPKQIVEQLAILLEACDDVARQTARGGTIQEIAAFRNKALVTQVEKPETQPAVPPMSDEAFFQGVGGLFPQFRDGWQLHDISGVLSNVEQLVTELRTALPSLPAMPREGLRLSTTAGTVVIMGTGDDIHDEGDDVVLVIDLGGNDTWLRGASASAKRPISICIDLGGDDHWGNGHDFSCGGALGGIAINWDCGGNDTYIGGNCSCGAGILGVGVLVDEGGDDVYRVKDFGIGAGAFGVGILLDKGGNDIYHDDLYGEGFASTWGCGVLVDLAGNDVYDAGGVHSDAPLHRDRTQSLSQGFSIGMRPDASGGVGVLVDVAGNDHYTADIYGQGASYWFSLGLLIDDDGNDTYTLGHYGQGAGIHLSAGMLLDRAGQDLYYDEYGVGMGGAHDYAVGFLVDRGGDDHYDGSGASQGGAITNSVAMLIDDGGNDGYTAVRGGEHGYGGAARETGSIGLFLDAGGKDVYSESTRDGKIWTSGLVGAGLDEPDPVAAQPPPDPMGAEVTTEAAKALVDKDGTVAGPDGKPVDDLDKLWAIGIRWQVGDERVIGPIARKRLVALGTKTLDRAIGKLGSKDGLELECVQAMLQAFPREQVVPKLLEATKSAETPVRKSAVRYIASLAITEAESRLIEMLADAEIRANVIRAIAALKKAPPAVLPFLHSPKEAEGVAVTLCLGAVGDAAAIDALIGCLGPDTAFPVRIAAGEQLAALGEKAVPALSKAAASAPTVRARRSALRALGATKSEASAESLLTAVGEQDDWIRLTAFEASTALLKSLPPDAHPTSIQRSPLKDLRFKMQLIVDGIAGVGGDPFLRRFLPR